MGDGSNKCLVRIAKTAEVLRVPKKAFENKEEQKLKRDEASENTKLIVRRAKTRKVLMVRKKASENSHCRPFLDPQEDAGTILSLSGFSKIALPLAKSPFVSQSGNPTRAPTTSSVPSMRRCHSDPYNPPKAGSNYFSGSGMVSASNLAPQSPPESSKIAGATAETTPASKATASLPTRPPILRRSVPDPSPNESYSTSLSSNDITVDESHRNQWMYKMKDIMREINQLLDEEMHDAEMRKEEEEDKGNGENNSEQVGETADCEKALSVKKTGECCVVQFRCQCAKAYELLFFDNDCYYKAA